MEREELEAETLSFGKFKIHGAQLGQIGDMASLVRYVKVENLYSLNFGLSLMLEMLGCE
jgi:hypothetical protein